MYTDTTAHTHTHTSRTLHTHIYMHTHFNINNVTSNCDNINKTIDNCEKNNNGGDFQNDCVINIVNTHFRCNGVEVGLDNSVSDGGR